MHPRKVEQIAAGVHGALAFGHLLGFFWNLQRGNYIQCVIHALGVGYDSWAVTQHLPEKEGTWNRANLQE